ncbi:TFIIH complex serine/threonine-protein kinase subunit kin28 [Imshaugia aleurites]|uniref:TFIIH complex serine/threonine-protein kinase subunit kin28 n=1 Tax=Imshaugia aleurites TaxID=172621 RepID=A0A8H3GAP6_9LECA|nr:TFIIH complex serine/threonine-protein kinase subunit kin28 [Imshaugia aleurites]
MAVSPVVTYDTTSNIKVTATKAKSLAVRTNSVSNPRNGSLPEPGKGQELAERLNDETKQRYVKDKKLGEGTYAIVYLGHLRADPSSLLAIKKIKVNTEYRDGLSMDAIREVKYLQELSHPNIIALHAVFSSKNQNLNLVLEYLPLGDLEMLIKDSEGIRYGTAEVKAWMGMLGRAVWFCHENFVLHRDIKPNNLLIAADGEVKLADFGLARSFSDPYRPMTYQVITRWYRPPELLFGARFYSGAVDVWSMGTVFAELILRSPFLAGNTDVHQLELICNTIGTPTEENWPGVSKLEGFLKYDKAATIPVRGREFYLSRFGTAGPVGVDLLMSMLALDPRKRCTARQVLEHKWWSSDPRPTAKEDLPKKGGGPERMGEDLKRKGGEIEGGRGDNVARKLNFGLAKS